jgi:alkylation response protein AidB-like acyl-CoA dehydrogenase
MEMQQAVDAARLDLEAWRATASANDFDGDRFVQRVLRRLLGERAHDLEERCRALADATGDAFSALVAESNRDENLPVLRRHDPDGRPLEEVVFHPDYHRVGRQFWASGVLAGLGVPGHEVACGALAYVLDRHGEAGHACPVACTAGAIKLLQKVGTDDQRRRYLPALLDPDYDRRLHAAQFVTEVQGGSDVGLNACRAVPEPGRPGWHRLSGEKWFCSVADAGLFVVSARLDGAPTGTRGLTLFLVPRRIDGAPNGFALRRLKYKLGTRSMATGEVEFGGALGEAIGPLEGGFKNLVGIVLDTSRVHNALAACGLMRRVEVEAFRFAETRLAFEHRIAEFPAVQEILARVRLRTMAAVATTFRILAMTDRIDTGGGSPDLVAARRIAVMINKYWTALASTRAARDGIEVLGGNGTIEDFSPLPRLYRDAIVIESWEGTHNTLCAQVLRDFATRGLQQPWLAVLEQEIATLIHPGLAEIASRARQLLAGVAEAIAAMLATDETTAAARIRHVVDRMCRLTDWVALAQQAQWDLEHGGGAEGVDALELYALIELERADVLSNPELVELHRRFAAA